MLDGHLISEIQKGEASWTEAKSTKSKQAESMHVYMKRKGERERERQRETEDNIYIYIYRYMYIINTNHWLNDSRAELKSVIDNYKYKGKKRHNRHCEPLRNSSHVYL